MNCPACGSTAAIELGTLGHAEWYRCRDCGMDYGHTVTGRTKTGRIYHTKSNLEEVAKDVQ